MKQSSSLVICVVTSSVRNIHAYHLLRERLEETGHTVQDWTAIRKSDPSRAFDFCSQSATGSDLVIYMAPVCSDASCLAGMAFNAGVRIFGFGDVEHTGFILPHIVQDWFEEPSSLLQAVETLAEEKAQAGIA